MEKVIVRTYSSDKYFIADKNKLEERGYIVQNVERSKEPYNAGLGCCLFFIFAPLALFARGGEKITVTYGHKGNNYGETNKI